jgi:ribosomal protein S18 acetylase RimI-like enzyme
MTKVAGVQQPLESELLTILQEAKSEVHTEELAERLGIVRHTAAKYLEILRARGLISYRKVGNAKLWKAFSDVIIRPLALEEDISTILRIEKSIEEERDIASGERLSYLEETARHRIERGQPCLGAEVNGKLAGFVLGEVRTWEFGSGERTGWIEVVGIDPEFWGLGIGRRLGEALLTEFKRRGVVRVRTLVDSYSGELIAYFRSLGFQILNMLPLEKQLVDSEVGGEPRNGYRTKERQER